MLLNNENVDYLWNGPPIIMRLRILMNVNVFCSLQSSRS